jgi:predicted nucleic acid-binding protein
MIPERLVETAADVSRQTGLLSNDAVLIAVMQTEDLTNLARQDSDFDRMPGLTHSAPV